MSSPDPSTALRLEQFDPATAPDATLRAAATFHETLRAERMPEDPPLDEAALIAGWRHSDGAAERCTLPSRPTPTAACLPVKRCCATWGPGW